MTSDLRTLARDVIDANHYLVLGTVDDDGRPRVSPVYFTHVGYQEFFWISSPDSHHSHNVAARPEVSFVVFDSTVPAGAGRAVYVDAVARQVAPDDLVAECARAFAGVGAIDYGPAELSDDADLRLYLARVSRHQVHVRGSDPTYGTGIDSRLTVTHVG